MGQGFAVAEPDEEEGDDPVLEALSQKDND